jgi:hypothetical protein
VVELEAYRLVHKTPAAETGRCWPTWHQLEFALASEAVAGPIVAKKMYF